MQLYNGRRLYRVCGRSVVHSDIMDCFFHNEARTEVIPLFQQALKAGRFTCELRGYLSFPLKANVQVLEIAPFKEPFCDSVFADSFINRATTVQPWNSTYTFQVATVPPGAQSIFLSRNAAYQSYPYYEYRCTMADGTTRIMVPTLTYIYQGSAEDTGDVSVMKRWFDTVYIPSVPRINPAVGMSYDDIIALGWKEKLSTFTRWINPPSLTL